MTTKGKKMPNVVFQTNLIWRYMEKVILLGLIILG